MDDSAIVLVLLFVTFVMGAISALFVGAMLLYRREDRARSPARDALPPDQSQQTRQ